MAAIVAKNDGKRKDDLLQRCRDFIQCRSILDSFADQNGFSRVTAIADINLLHINGEYNPVFQQVNVKGQAVTNVDDYCEMASFGRRYLENVLIELEKAAGMKAGNCLTVKNKAKESLINKATGDYSTRIPGPGFSWVMDGCRCSVVCEGEEQMVAVVTFLTNSPMVSIARLKNRFINPLPAGYRDILITVKVPIETREKADNCYHLCEIQIHHKALKELSVSQKSINHYEYFRRYFNASFINEKVAVVECVSRLSPTDSLELFISDILENTSFGAQHYTALHHLLCRIGEFAHAEVIQRRAFAIELAKNGGNDNSKEVIDALHHLMVILKSQNDLVATEDVCRRLLAARSETLGLYHLDTVKTVDKLAEVLYRMKRYDEAEAMFYKALQGKETVLGSDHESTLATIDNLSDILRTQGKFEDAEAITELAMEAREKSLGVDHSSTMKSRYNLGMIQLKREETKKAEATLKVLQQSRARVFGAAHPQSIAILEIIGSIFEGQERWPEAEHLHLKCLKAREIAVGQDHKDTINSVFSLANVYSKQDKLARAAASYYRAYRGLLTLYGEENTKTIYSLKKAKDSLILANRVVPTSVEDAKIHLQNNIYGYGSIERRFEHENGCMLCETKFTVVVREHHCRVCYLAICNSCSAPNKMLIPLLNPRQQVRVCKVCSAALALSPLPPPAQTNGH